MTDMHIERAAKLFGCKPEDVTPEMRRRAKEVYWMENYKASPETMAALMDYNRKDVELTQQLYQAMAPRPTSAWKQLLIVVVLTTVVLLAFCAGVYLITRGN